MTGGGDRKAAARMSQESRRSGDAFERECAGISQEARVDEARRLPSEIERRRRAQQQKANVEMQARTDGAQQWSARVIVGEQD